MLTPEQYRVLPDNIVNLYEQLEAWIIQDIARRISNTRVVTRTAEWQIMRLNELGISESEITERIARAVKKSKTEIRTLYEDAAKISAEFDANILKKAGKEAVSLKNNYYLQSFISSIIKQTNGKFENLTQSMGFMVSFGGNRNSFVPVAKVYQRSLDFATLQIASGAIDYNTAIMQAIRELSNSGLRFVDYESGIFNHIDVAVRRAILTGMGQITGKISEANSEILGTDLVEVTAHAGARPDHKLWQGKIYSLHGDSPKYPNLSKATGYGTVKGLKGANCRHDFFPFFAGISERTYTNKDLQNIDPEPFIYEGKIYTAYDATQHQRNIERSIKASKRRCMGYKAASLDNAFKIESIRLRRLQDKYKNFSTAASLPLQIQRIRVIDFNQTLAVSTRQKSTM